MAILLRFKFLLWVLLLPACSTVKEAVQYQIEDGLYRSEVFGVSGEKVYVDNEIDSLFVFPVLNTNNNYLIDTSSREYLVFPQNRHATKIEDVIFRTSGFDIDLITIPFKYRFQSNDFPPQITTNLNALIFLGHRADFYRLHYRKNDLSTFDRATKHYGVTYGFFSGFGSSSINPFVTQNNIQIEYDGVVWSNGFALSFGIDNISLGLGLGWDYLLDKNSNFWIYHKKPWLGLVLGINLN
jgi:hypothetical protein